MLHCLVIKDIESGFVFSCTDHQYSAGHPAIITSETTDDRWGIEDGLRLLMKADQIIGHNIIKFDLPAIQKVYPWFTYDEDKVLDTLTCSRLIWTNIADVDASKIRRGTTTLTPRLIGSHGLEAWGHRTGNWKGDYSKVMQEQGLDPWASWNPEMQSYCEQDVEVNHDVLKLIEKKQYSQQAIDLEHKVAFILAAQERAGFKFDVEEAEKLSHLLIGEQAVLEDQLCSLFEPWEVFQGIFVPKRPNRKLGYTGHYEVDDDGKKTFVGDPVRKTKTVVFNPNSRDHIADRLKVTHGWKPTEFTPSGKPKIDDKILGSLPYPEAAQLARYMLLQKRIGQLADGRQAWLKHVTPEGRIHGGVIPNGAVTGRATHSNPNIGQVPSCTAEYGHHCRALFTATPGHTRLLGCDVSGLELRMLGHFMAKHDGGAYADIVVNGDIHSANAAALNGMTYEEFFSRKHELDHLRQQAKTFIYAFLYGAGDEKLGSIVGGNAADGTALRAKFLKGLPALMYLIGASEKDINTAKWKLGKELKKEKRNKAVIDALRQVVNMKPCGVKNTAERRGYLKGLDGRFLHIRSSHAALNTLLQSAGAIVCKQWMVEFHKLLKERGFSDQVTQVAWVHDELQMEVAEDLVYPEWNEKEQKTEFKSIIGDICVEAIAKTGVALGIRVALTGEYKIGNNWAETH